MMGTQLVGGAFFLGLGVGVMFMTLVCVYVMTMAVKEDRLRRKVRAEMERDGSYPKSDDACTCPDYPGVEWHDHGCPRAVSDGA